MDIVDIQKRLADLGEQMEKYRETSIENLTREQFEAIEKSFVHRHAVTPSGIGQGEAASYVDVYVTDDDAMIIHKFIDGVDTFTRSEADREW